MARKPRVHFPGAFYHVILRGNGGQDIFFCAADRSRFYLLLQEGIERYRHRIHAFCLMSNHAHLLIQVGEVSLSRIIQNVSFRYTRYCNTRKNKTGHLFQGRYKAIVIDNDSYLVELVRYIHCNPVRAGLITTLSEFQHSSHHSYLAMATNPWLTTSFVLSQFAEDTNRARQLYLEFVQKGIKEPHRQEFHCGTQNGIILGDENFAEKAFSLAQKNMRRQFTLTQIIDTVCLSYGITQDILIEPGKKQPAAEARAVAAYLVQGEEGLSLTALGHFFHRDVAALSRAGGRIGERLREDPKLTATIDGIRHRLCSVEYQNVKPDPVTDPVTEG